MLFENTCFYTKLLDIFRKNGCAFVNQCFLLFLMKKTGVMDSKLRSNKSMLLYCFVRIRNLWMTAYTWFNFFPLPSFWICEQKKKQIWFHGGYFCSVADTTSATHKLSQWHKLLAFWPSCSFELLRVTLGKRCSQLPSGTESSGYY